MSLPRQLLAYSVYLVTRRCSERRSFLRPDEIIVEIVGYLLAVAMAKCGVEVHCFIFMSNHYHAVVSDPRCKLPRFLAFFHRLVAVVVNVYRGRWESLWSNDKTSVVRLETPDDVLDKMVYVIVNAIAAGLVPDVAEWPGLKSDPTALLAPPKHFLRPSVYFSRSSKLPESAPLQLSKPRMFEDLTDAEFVALLTERVEAKQAELVAKTVAEGRGFLGAEAAKKGDWNSAPRTQAPRRTRNPHIAAKDVVTRCRAIARLKAFRKAYREARARWIAGDRETVFPAGTYLMRVVFRVECEAWDADPTGARSP